MKMRPLHGIETLGNEHQLMGMQDLRRIVLKLGSVHLKLQGLSGKYPSILNISRTGRVA